MVISQARGHTGAGGALADGLDLLLRETDYNHLQSIHTNIPAVLKEYRGALQPLHTWSYKTRISPAFIRISLTAGCSSPCLQILFLGFQLLFCCIIKTGSSLITVKLSCDCFIAHCKTLTARTWSANHKDAAEFFWPQLLCQMRENAPANRI